MASLQEEASRLKALAVSPLGLQALASRFNCPPSLAAIFHLAGMVEFGGPIDVGDVKGKFKVRVTSGGTWDLAGEIKDDGAVFGDDYTFKLQILVDGQPVTRRYEKHASISAGGRHWWFFPAPEHDDRIVSHWGAIVAGRAIARWSMKVGPDILPDAEWGGLPTQGEIPGT